LQRVRGLNLPRLDAAHLLPGKESPGSA
jgi:hypothetical protein